MAAATRRTGGLDALLDTATVEPDAVEPEAEPQIHTADAEMGMAEPESAAEPDSELAPVLEKAEPFEAKAPAGWDDDLEGAPQDGKPVFLIGPPTAAGEPQICEAIWRHSREFDKRQGRWVGVAFWAVRNCAGIRVAFEPIGWKPAL